MGVKIREKRPGSGEFWVFVSYQGKRTSRKVGDRGAAEQVARQIQARLTLGKDALGTFSVSVRLPFLEPKNPNPGCHLDLRSIGS